MKTHRISLFVAALLGLATAVAQPTPTTSNGPVQKVVTAGATQNDLTGPVNVTGNSTVTVKVGGTVANGGTLNGAGTFDFSLGNVTFRSGQIPNAALGNASVTISGHVLPLGSTLGLVSGDISNFTAAAAAASPVQSVAGRTGAVTLTPSDVSLGSVTNDAQTKAAIVPNTVPTAGQVLVGNAGGTAYAPVSVSGDLTLASTGAATLSTVNTNVGTFGDATHSVTATVDGKGRVTAISAPLITPAWSSITATPTTLAGYGITDPIVLTSGSYADPAWITSLAWSKITSTPTSAAGYGIVNGAKLDTFGALTWAADTAPYFTGAGTASTYSLSAYARTVLGAANAAAWRSTTGSEAAITAGTTAQYWRGDKTWQTLNQAAVAGLTTSDSPTFAGLTITAGGPSISAPSASVLGVTASYLQLAATRTYRIGQPIDGSHFSIYDATSSTTLASWDASGNLVNTGTVTINAATPSTLTTNGALVVTGGVGVGRNVIVAGAVNLVGTSGVSTNNAQSVFQTTDNATPALTVRGGDQVPIMTWDSLSVADPNIRNWGLKTNSAAYGDFELWVGASRGASPFGGTKALAFDYQANATLGGNLTVNGTGVSIVAGTLQLANAASQASAPGSIYTLNNALTLRGDTGGLQINNAANNANNIILTDAGALTVRSDLTVNGTGTSSFAGLVRSTDGTSALNIGITGGVPYVQGFSPTTSQIAFYTNTERMRLMQGLNIGGTTDPGVGSLAVSSTISAGDSITTGHNFVANSSDPNSTELDLLNSSAGGHNFALVSWGSAAGGGTLAGQFSIYDNTGGGHRLRINTSGDAIFYSTTAATSTSTGSLVVGSNIGLSGNAGGTSYFGGTVVAGGVGGGYASQGTGFANASEWSNSAVFGTTSFGFLQDSTGQTFINAATGKAVHLRVNNVDMATVDASGANFAGYVAVAGSLQLGNAYLASTYTTATGSVDLKDSTGTTYHVLVHN